MTSAFVRKLTLFSSLATIMASILTPLSVTATQQNPLLAYETKGSFAAWALANFAHRPANRVLPASSFKDLPKTLRPLAIQALSLGVVTPDSHVRIGFNDRLTKAMAATGIVHLLDIKTETTSPYNYALKAGWFVGIPAGSFLRRMDMFTLVKNVNNSRMLTSGYSDAKSGGYTASTPVVPFTIPSLPASGEQLLPEPPSALAVAANKALKSVPITPPTPGAATPVRLTKVIIDPNNPDVVIAGTVTKSATALSDVWVQIDELGTKTGSPAQWQYDVPLHGATSFAASLHIPFPADSYRIEAAPPLTTAQTSLNYSFASKEQSASQVFTMTFPGVDTDQQIGLLTSVWANLFDPNIQALAKEITKNATTPLDQAQAVYDWEAQNIDYNGPLLANNGYGWSTTEETLATRRGICVDYANVADAIMRSLGVPTEMVAGYANDPGSGMADNGNNGHAWNRSWIGGKWVYWDPTWSREYFTSSATALPKPGDLYIFQPQWFNPAQEQLDATHTMIGIQDQ